MRGGGQGRGRTADLPIFRAWDDSPLRPAHVRDLRQSIEPTAGEQARMRPEMSPAPVRERERPVSKRRSRLSGQGRDGSIHQCRDWRWPPPVPGNRSSSSPWIWCQTTQGKGRRRPIPQRQVRHRPAEVDWWWVRTHRNAAIGPRGQPARSSSVRVSPTEQTNRWAWGCSANQARA